jgi:hypothetical protein
MRSLGVKELVACAAQGGRSLEFHMPRDTRGEMGNDQIEYNSTLQASPSRGTVTIWVGDPGRVLLSGFQMIHDLIASSYRNNKDIPQLLEIALLLQPRFVMIQRPYVF